MAGSIVALVVAGSEHCGPGAVAVDGQLARSTPVELEPGRRGSAQALDRRGESRDETIKRCDVKPLASTVAERAVRDGGWIPFLNFDQQLLQGDIRSSTG